MRTSSWILAGSVGAHLALGAGVGALRGNQGAHGATAISVLESKKKPLPPPKDEPPPPPPKTPDTPAKEKRAAKAKAAEAKPPPDAPPPNAAPAAMDALPDFGLSLSGGVGPGGFAVPTGGGGEAKHGPAAAPAPKAGPAPPKPIVDDCTEALVKPKPVSVPQPAYTPAAREANVQGKVRVEVSVDASGHVTNAKLLAGLGYGLDEAALAAARSASFSPATKCGKATATTFVTAMRFAL